MKIQMIAKLTAVGLLSMGLTSCFVSGQEESSIALAKWHGQKINDFFFKFGKGEFQAQNSQGKKAYAWASPKRVVEIPGEQFVVKVPDQFFPGKTVTKIISAESTYETYQCLLRIETTGSDRITSFDNLKDTGECARYFSLSTAEIEALLAARK